MNGSIGHSALLTVVIPTKNEAANIESAIRAFEGTDGIEIVVVDNHSPDATVEIARKCGAKVFTQGPERSAQRNRGAREASAPWIMFLDADMIVPRETVAEILDKISSGDVDALWVRETRVGKGLRAKARNFERSFYDGTVVDAVRVVRKSLFLELGGYDEELLTANEDWDLDIRLKAMGARIALTDGALVHNENMLSLATVLKKKRYYGKTFATYRKKWQGNADVRKQFSFTYRYFGVFFENGKWKKVLRHPILFATMFFERVLVGVVYIMGRR
ncbi:MAG: glycosyltransferase [Kiritimatiellae bacterium]|nr:glycosyltransferase [Kiritimatiellia bacterium]